VLHRRGDAAVVADFGGMRWRVAARDATAPGTAPGEGGSERRNRSTASCSRSGLAVVRGRQGGGRGAEIKGGKRTAAGVCNLRSTKFIFKTEWR
jgi:hypothetical protein